MPGQGSTLAAAAPGHGQVALEAKPVALDPGVPWGFPVPWALGSLEFRDLRNWLLPQRPLAMAWHRRRHRAALTHGQALARQHIFGNDC